MRYLIEQNLIEVALNQGMPGNVVTVRQVSGIIPIELGPAGITTVELFFDRASRLLTDILYVLQPGHEYGYFEVSVDPKGEITEVRVMRQVTDGPMAMDELNKKLPNTLRYKDQEFYWTENGLSEVLIISDTMIQAQRLGWCVWNTFKTHPDESGNVSQLVVATGRHGLGMYYGHVIKAQHASIVMPVVE